ncbi:acetamidase [Nesterenkonia sp. MY13]|uniref:Acetamidase n=1 Tax=Nesterenkonia sedimenti TaxID=1463632 RepID=A0A7X8YDW7_9MICC|nr:acetamidase/formamidase family protein [Nesterenkonia sedimenti]NLS09969.1 acetamidase [Nesterenkonia sedimenti]
MTHYEVPQVYNRLWTTEHEPVLHIGSGDTLSFDVLDAADGLYRDYENGGPLPERDPSRAYPLRGPIMVADAQPGDVLEIEPLEFSTMGWGWTGFRPGAGLLPEDFAEPFVYKWDLTAGDTATFLDVADIALRPFLGVLGCTPDTREGLGVMPPGHFGGNMDIRDSTAGTKVYLPVQVEGARLMFGDPHAAQGDGEVCVSAIEAPLEGTLKVSLHKDRRISAPQFRTPGPLRSGIEDAGYYATTGIGPDLMEASRDAVRAMIDYLVAEYKLEPRHAYVLCSVVVDLKISEVVDAPNWVVSAYLPLSVMR